MADMLFPPCEPQRDFALTNKLVYSFPKTGKTTLMSLMRDKQGRPPLFVQTEEGSGELRLQRALIRSWEGFQKFVGVVETNKARLQTEHSNFVIDLVSDLDDMCTAYICDKHKVASLSDLEYGKGQYLQRKAFKEAMFKLMAILPVSFIAHSGEREIIWNGEKIKIQSPTMSKGALEFVNGKVDTIMWIQPAGLKVEYPMIIVENTLTCISGSRYPQLVGRYRYDPKDPGKAVRDIEAAFARGDNARPTVSESIQSTITNAGITTIADTAAQGSQPAVPTP